MTMTLRQSAEALLAVGPPAVLVEVTATRGSVPRESGTRMLVTDAGVQGTIGGGHLEWKAIATARLMLRNREFAPRSEHFPLGPALGQCCGGAVTIGLSRLDAEAMAKWPEAAPRLHLQLYGAGHVGRAVATLLATLDVEVDWIDERDEEFPATTSFGTPWPSRIRQVCVDAVDAEVATAPPGAYFLVLTHNHDLDLRITEAILRRGDFAWAGLIGSKTKRARFFHRFEARGIPAERLARLACPIGVEGIVGKEPEVIAMAVVAQLLQAHSKQPAQEAVVAPARLYSA